MSAVVLMAPYAAVMVYAWDRRKTNVGIIVCVTAAAVEALVAAHLWIAGAL